MKSFCIFVCFTAFSTYSLVNALKCYTCDGVCECRNPVLENCSSHSHCYTIKSIMDKKKVEKMGCSADCSYANPYTQTCNICRGDLCNQEQGLLLMSSNTENADDCADDFQKNGMHESTATFRRSLNDFEMGQGVRLSPNPQPAIGDSVSLSAGDNFSPNNERKIKHREYSAPSQNSFQLGGSELQVGDNFALNNRNRNFNQGRASNYYSGPLNFNEEVPDLNQQPHNRNQRNHFMDGQYGQRELGGLPPQFNHFRTEGSNSYRIGNGVQFNGSTQIINLSGIAAALIILLRLTIGHLVMSF